MASKKVHLDQAKHNETLSNQLLKTEHFDWSCVLAFYSALHYSEAYFKDKLPDDFENLEDLYKKTKKVVEMDEKTIHQFRGKLISTRLGADAFVAYEHLKNTSEKVRYLNDIQINSYDFFTKETMEKIVKQLSVFKSKTGF